jgi:catechol 2,3-dioxygenase-like lactoylglutathione lyase family enzyme
MMSEIVAVVEMAISVNDLDAAEAFYRDVLGLGELKK